MLSMGGLPWLARERRVRAGDRHLAGSPPLASYHIPAPLEPPVSVSASYVPAECLVE